MKAILLGTIFLLIPNLGTLESSSADNIVYICTGSSSKRYHKTDDCRGLNNCKGTIVKISQQKAREMGRTACKICY
jgi:hypothetical protein